MLPRIVNTRFIWYQLLNELVVKGQGKKVKMRATGYRKTQSREIIRYLPRPRGVDLSRLVLDLKRWLNSKANHMELYRGKEDQSEEIRDKS